MLPVAGKPMVENILDRAKAVGFNRFVLTLHYLGHVVEDYFGDGSRFGINVSYVREERPLGTAGALQLISPRPAEPIVVTNGDVLTDINYSELLDFHIRNKASATMAVRIHEWQHPFGVVQTKGLEIFGFEEKPIYRSHVNAGVYVIEPDILDTLPQGVPCDMPELFEAARQAGKRTIVYPMHEPWLDIGRPSDYEQASGDVQQIGTLL
jgi:NDP-sugar pyrophosphorylase family protein